MAKRGQGQRSLAREVIAHRQEKRIRKSEVVVVVKGREHANKISKRVRE